MTGTVVPMDQDHLTVQDRCDRCGAQAYLRATLPSNGQLLFCGHHAADNEEKLKAIGAKIFDQREQLVGS